MLAAVERLASRGFTVERLPVDSSGRCTIPALWHICFTRFVNHSAWPSKIALFSSIASFLFWVMCGVLQGCPLAGSMFVLVFDPFVNKFQKLIDHQKLGIVRQCAR